MPQKFVEHIQPFLDNSLDRSLDQRQIVTGILGDRPSLSAKSPVLWNATYRGLDLNASFEPFDVSAENLAGLVQALRQEESFVGGSVTVPYKSQVMESLDGLDPKARQIGAVNTIARDGDGRLIGYNTDAQGALDSLIKRLPNQQQAYLEEVEGLQVMLIGAGGAGRAVAFAMSEAIGATGHITIVNRDPAKSAELAGKANDAYGNVSSAAEGDIPALLPESNLIINASLRGQSGLRQTSNNLVTCLEPYSALMPANPAQVQQEGFANTNELYRSWYESSLQDILENQSQSAHALLRAPSNAIFWDIIYSPLETILLGQARLAGHVTINGKGMNIAQAVDGLVNRVLCSFIQDQGWEAGQVYDQVFELMAEVW